MYQYDYFIAYAGPDGDAAQRLYDRLIVRGSVFLATRERPGGAWDETIARAQRGLRATVVVLSARSREGYYLREEIAAAIDLYRRSRHHVVPFLLEPLTSEQIPYGLLRLQHVQLTSSVEEAAAEIERITRQPFGSREVVAATRGRISYVSASGETTTIEISEGETLTLGRAAGNAIVFDSERVSAAHAELSLSGGILWVRDSNSKNGVYVNGRESRRRSS